MRINPAQLMSSLRYVASVSLLLLASCGGGGGGASPTPTPATPPAAPTGLTAVAGCNGATVYLNWGLATGATGYNVYRSATSGGTASKITATPLVAGSYIDSGRTFSTPYFYKVTAVNAAGESANSTEATATTGASSTCNPTGGSVQGHPLSLSTAVSTLAGTVGGAGSADGTGTAATFSTPSRIATDGTNLYVADTNNNSVRQINIATRVVTTLATGFNKPKGITLVGTNLYVADTQNNAIKVVALPGGAVTQLVAGGLLSLPEGITTNGTNLYIANAGNSNILSVTVGGAGLGVFATGAPLSSPQGIIFDGTDLYVTDSGSILKVTLGGVVTTFVAAGFSSPQGITSDGINLYVAAAGTHTVSKVVIGTAAVSAVAGLSATPGSADGTGTAARFNTPGGITTDGMYLYVVDTGNQTIREIQ